jgi:hypothetical protein
VLSSQTTATLQQLQQIDGILGQEPLLCSEEGRGFDKRKSLFARREIRNGKIRIDGAKSWVLSTIKSLIQTTLILCNIRTFVHYEENIWTQGI